MVQLHQFTETLDSVAMEIDAFLAAKIADLQRRLFRAALDQPLVDGILSEIGELVGADAAMGAWLSDGMPWLTTWRAGPQIEAYFMATTAGVDRDGNLRSHDPDLDRLNRVRRGLGTGVFHEQALAPRDVIANAAYHREAFAPAGMNHVMGMTSRLSVGEAIFAFGYDDAEAPALVNGRAETLLTLLLPAFEHCFQTLDRRHRHRERLAKAISEASLPATILNADEDVPPDSLLQLPLPELAPGSGTPPYLSVSAPESASLAARLAQTYALTERQRLTAELLLSGLTTDQIADEMGVRYNTARRHCEAVLQKTGAGKRHRLARMATGGGLPT